MKALLVLFLTLTFCQSDACEVERWYGEGEHESIVGFQWGEGKVLVLGYRYSGVKYADEMLTDIDAQEERLNVEWGYGGKAVVGMSWDVDNDGLVSDADWFQEGLDTEGFWAYWVWENAGEVWVYSDVGVFMRELTPGAQDFWLWGSANQKIEPSIKCFR